jgi:GNAT superfamily N-acetyltransferase
MRNVIEIVKKTPSATEYNMLRKAVGWQCFEHERATFALSNSLYAVCAITNDQIVGFGRIVGDGIYYYIHDVVIKPEYQKQGIGYRIMDKLMNYLDKNAPKHSGVFIGLMSAPGLEKFYGKYGLTFLPNDTTFMCSWRKVQSLEVRGIDV